MTEIIEGKIYSNAKITLGTKFLKKHNLKEGDTVALKIVKVINVSKLTEKEMKKE